MKLTKAVFPVAGLGTRFLPATKASPKEMLPIIDKPIIQYAVEEVLELGVNTLIFVTSNGKRAIEDHFDKNHQLEEHLLKTHKEELLQELRNIIPRNVNCIYLRQQEMLGLGHAILCAKPVLGNEPFIVSLADDLIYNKNKSCLAQMIEIFNKNKKSVIATKRIPLEDSSKYGIVDTEDNGKKESAVISIVEKPKPKDALSDIASIGRYIFSPKILDLLDNVPLDNNGEIQLTSAIQMLSKIEPVYSYIFEGIRYDCGDKLGYLKATVDYALRHDKFGQKIREHISSIL